MAEQETLQQLVHRRQREIGGTTGPISARQVWLRGGGDDHWSYEIVRKIIERGHSNIGDKIAERLAIALNVPVSKIHAAAGQRQRGTPFQLPARSAQLTQTEREILRMVMDAMLGQYADDNAPTKRTSHLRSVRAIDIPEPDLTRVAARRGRSRGKEQIRAQDDDAERGDAPDGDE